MKLRAGALPPGAGPTGDEHDGDDRGEEGPEDEAEAFLENGSGIVQAPVVEEDRLSHAEAIARPRQRPQNREVPEEDLQQQGDVAQYLDVDRGDPGDQPVAGKPGDADDETERRGQRDTDDGHQNGVEQADHHGTPVRILFDVVDEALADAEAGGFGEKAETRGDALPLEIREGVVDEKDARGDHAPKHEGLKEHRAIAGIVPDRRLGRRCGQGHLGRAGLLNQCRRPPGPQSPRQPEEGAAASPAAAPIPGLAIECEPVSAPAWRTAGRRPSTAH